MAQITLSRANVVQLLSFCTEHKQDKFFVAKDHGAYVGANAKVGEKMKNVLFFFAGCDPEKHEDWYDTAKQKFGGDDFGEMLPIKALMDFVAEPRATGLVLSVTPKHIKMAFNMAPAK